jgi:hypothetical protein
MSGGNGPPPAVPPEATRFIDDLFHHLPNLSFWPFVIGALAPMIWNGLTALAANWWTRKLSAEQAFDQAIEGFELDKLGDYVHSHIGRITTQSYIFDRTIRDRVDRYFDRITKLVGSTADEEAEVVGEPQDGSFAPEPQLFDDVPPRSPSWMLLVQAAENTLKEGDEWSAFSRLRRDVEVRLAGMRDNEGNPFIPPESALPAELREAYRHFRSTANAVVHGKRVSAAQSRLALQNVDRVLAFVDARASFFSGRNSSD